MLALIAVVLALGVGAIWAAWKLRVPSILILLTVGLLAGPITRAISGLVLGYTISVDPSKLIGAQTLMDLVALAVGLILFEGGLTLNWREISDVRRVVALLVTVGALVTLGLTSVAANVFLGMDWSLALLLAAVLIVTGPTVIGPLLRFIRPTGKVGPVLRWEGITIDPLGAMMAVLVFEAIAAEMATPAGISAAAALVAMVRGAALTMLVGVAIGVTAALVLIVSIRRLLVPDQLQIPLTLAFLVAAFTGSNAIAGEAGLFATTTMGIAMANQRRASIRHIVEFKENISTLLIATLFVVLAARLDLASLAAISPGVVLFLLALVLVIRPASVLLSTSRSMLSMRERLFICWMAPRGIVAAAVASLFALRLENFGVEGAESIVTYTFLVVVATVALYGLSAPRVARWLGLAKRGQRGFLIVGADAVARNIGKFLTGEGLEVLLVDTNPANIREARLLGLPVAPGNALSTDVLERVELSPLGHLMALTSNDEVNAMAAVQFGRIFGRQNAYQVAEKRRPNVPTARAQSDRELSGRVLFGPEVDYPKLEHWFAQGARIRKTRLTPEFGLADYVKRHGDRAIPLLVIKPAGVTLLTTDKSVSAAAGDQVVSLVMPDQPAEAASAGAPAIAPAAGRAS